MNKLTLTLLATVLASGQAMAECSAPASPSIPDGASSKLEDMIEGQKAVKAFQAANMDYMKCLEAQFTAAEAAAKEGSDDDKAAATKVYDESIEAYNAAVSAEEDVAGRFNTEIRAYKAANPG